MKNLFLGIFVIFILTGCASKKDFLNMTTDEMKEDCNGKDEFKSCFRLGKEYFENNDVNLALTYYSKGCRSWYDTGIINKISVERRDINSCLKEAEILKDYKDLDPKIKNKSRLEYVADYYFINEDFAKAYEYYQAYLKENKDGNQDILYNMSKILLNGLGGIPQNIELSEIYFLRALRFEVSSVINKSLRIYKILNKFPTMKMKIEILANGKVSDIIIIKTPNDETVIPKLEKDLMKYTFHLIPNEYITRKIIIPITISKE